MPRQLCIAVVGATGAVGVEILKVLEQRNFPLKSLRCFASSRSIGKKATCFGQEIAIEPLNEERLEGLDIAIFSAGRKVSLEWAPIFAKRGIIVVDNSSAFRMDPQVPLIIPEINAVAMAQHKGIIASPNCSTTIMLMALAPLHRAFGVKRVVAATYQAASGAGAQAMLELELETRAYLEARPFSRTVMPFPYAFNLFTHNSPLLENGYVEEEIKMVEETRKILADQSLRITATCVRVPILRAHSEALNIEFSQPVTKEEAYTVLQRAAGIKIFEDRSQNRFPMPIDASGRDAVFCGRIREDLSQPNTLDLWVVGDQLLKGAALNAVQIAEHLIKEGIIQLSVAPLVAEAIRRTNSGESISSLFTYPRQSAINAAVFEDH